MTKIFGIWAKRSDSFDTWMSAGGEHNPHPVFHTEYIAAANAQLHIWQKMIELNDTLDWELSVREIGEDGLPMERA